MVIIYIKKMTHIFTYCIIGFFSWVVRWGYEKSLLYVKDGIKVCDLAEAEEHQARYWCENVVEALELIQSYDLRRYRRVQKHLSYIVNNKCTNTGYYNPYTRTCSIDFAKYRLIQDKNWRLLQLARLLVHEATHGVIFMQSISWDVEKHVRAERLCHQEERLFSQHVRPDALIKDFDETWCRKRYQQSLVQRVLEASKVIKASNNNTE